MPGASGAPGRPRPCTGLLGALCNGQPGNPASVEKYLASKFGDHLEEARAAMAELAAAHESGDLNRRGFRLYERFRPEVPRGESGCDAMGEPLS